jgi:hypothetical protein
VQFAGKKPQHHIIHYNLAIYVFILLFQSRPTSFCGDQQISQF